MGHNGDPIVFLDEKFIEHRTGYQLVNTKAEVGVARLSKSPLIRYPSYGFNDRPKTASSAWPRCPVQGRCDAGAVTVLYVESGTELGLLSGPSSLRPLMQVAVLSLKDRA